MKNQPLNIKTTVFAHWTNEYVEMTLVRVTQTMLILHSANGRLLRLNRQTGTEGKSVRSRCYSIPKEHFQALKEQIPSGM